MSANEEKEILTNKYTGEELSIVKIPMGYVNGHLNVTIKRGSKKNN